MNKPLFDNLDYSTELVKTNKSKLTKQQKEENVIDWILFFRNNIDVFVVDYLGIKLKPFQRDMIRQMAKGDIVDIVASRGLSKSFMVSIFAIAWSLLYPKTEVVIVSLTLGQANNIISEKIEKELCGKKTGLSRVLVQLMDDGWMRVSKDAQTGAKYIEFDNGSTIKAGTLGESLRGTRSTVLITDECCLVKKKDYEEIVEPTNRPRQIEGLPKWYREEPKQIFLTSARSKTNWFYKHLKNCVVGHYKKGRIKYSFYFGDIYTAVCAGIQSVNQFLQRKKNTDPMSFEQEYLNVFLGSSDNSLFRYEDFEQNQILLKPFYARSILDILEGIDNPYKFSDEHIRILVVDIALATGNENDNTVFIFASINPKNGKRKIENVITLNGLNSLEQAKLMKRYFYEYKATYFMMDSKGVGNGIFDILTVETEDLECGKTYPAWTVCTDKKLQISSDTVINDKIQRTMSSEAVEVIIPYAGTTELNSQMHFALRKALRDKSIELLQDEYEVRQKADDLIDGYTLMTSEKKAEVMNPYLQTKLMINEAISLETKLMDGGNIKLQEASRLDTKDRYMTLAMCNLLADKIVSKYSQEDEYDELDIDDFSEIYNY